jgi:hypothetical protein
MCGGSGLDFKADPWIYNTCVGAAAGVFPRPVISTRPRLAGGIMDLALRGNRALQLAVRRNRVCFPSQAPVFGRKPRRDLQWRLAVLYFIHGWSTREIARRYHLTRERCGQIISDWRPTI